MHHLRQRIFNKGNKKSNEILNEKVEDCVYCGKSFPHKIYLKHKAEEEKNLKCQYCDKYFETVQLYRRHTYRYHKLYTCKICNVKFLKGAYEYHVNSMHRTKPKCKVCYKTFATKLSLLAHEKKIHLGLRDERFECQICKYKAPDKFQFKIHMSRHNKAPSFVCDRCGSGHYTKTELDKHIQADHCGGYVCTICKKTFRSPGYLKKHLIIHEPNYDPNEINFTCEECGKGFLNQLKFKKHLSRHKNEGKFYNCNICNKNTTSKSSFKTHLRMHSGRKPYNCRQCEKTFSDKKYLIEHENNHLKEKIFTCNMCDETFSHCKQFSNHKQSHLM